MKQTITPTVLVSGLLLCSVSAFAAMEDDPLLYMLKVDQLEARDTDAGAVTAWEGHKAFLAEPGWEAR